MTTTDLPASPTEARPEARLYGYGRLDWDQARAVLDGATCIWADLGGLHLAPAPDAAPPTSHLWAWWPGGDCARLRIDETQAYTAVLRAAGTPPLAAHPRPVADEPVSPLLRAGAPLWGTADPQAGPVPAALREHTWDLLEIPGPRPITFVRASTPPDPPAAA